MGKYAYGCWLYIGLRVKELQFIRTSLYYIIVVLWLFCFLPAFLILVISKNKQFSHKMMRLWCRVNNHLLKFIVGLSYRIEGLENLPTTPALFICKHQAAWETAFFVSMFDKVSIIYKKELELIPIAGGFLKHSNMLSLNRALGAKELPKLLSDGADIISKDYSMLMFPEGTRSLPMQTPPFKGGFKLFAKKLKIPIVPVALNSGLLWQRRRFTIHSGVISVKFLPAVELDHFQEGDITQHLHAIINKETSDLIDEDMEAWYKASI